MPARVIPMLPCADIDQIVEFFVSLGFEVTYRQTRPNPYVALEGYGFPLHYYGLNGHRAEESHSTCGVVVAGEDHYPVCGNARRPGSPNPRPSPAKEATQK